MAGYFLYSLDWDKFQRFVNSPSKAQLLALAGIISDGLDENDGEFDEGDPVHDWPSEPEELSPLVQARLALPDWYGDLSQVGRNIWERGIIDFCQRVRPKEVGFRVDSDGVYWDVIDLARKHHGIRGNMVTEAVLSHFGTRPYRYVPELNRQFQWEDWSPMHSMHTPDEVRQLLEQLNQAGPTIKNSGDRGALEDYENELMPTLDKLVGEGRMLYVQVDT